ncbi:MAG: TolC family protein [Candidatus Omnitrophica bacterium]|nr:TolC family protein [Candidatus Omnitrophota bacterium]
MSEFTKKIKKNVSANVCFSALVGFLLLCSFSPEAFSQGSSANNPQAFQVDPAVDAAVNARLGKGARKISINDCVVFSIYHSFDVELAKLDLYVKETDLMYKEAVFDAFILGGASYAEDKRQQLSVFAADDKQTNEYYVEVEKTLPTGTELSAKWSDTRSWSNTVYTSKNPSHSAELLFEAVQPIGKNIFGYVDRGKVSLTRLAIESADFEMKDTIETFIAKVEKLYWELVFEKKSLEIYEDMLNRAKTLYESDKKNFNIGMIEKVDLLNSEANVEKRKAEFIASENAYRRAEENLKLAINLEEETRIFPEESLDFEYMDKTLPYCLEEAFEYRQDYKEKKKDVEVMGLDLLIKANEKWPEVDLNASLAMNGVEVKFDKAFGKTTVADNTYYYAGIEVNIPVENREARAEYKRVNFEKEKAIVELKEKERTIITEVGNAYRDVRTFQTSLQYFGRAVELQTEKLSEEEKRFEYGRSSTKRIIDYQRDLLMAELENALFLLKHRKANVELDKSTGIIYEKYKDQI